MASHKRRHASVTLLCWILLKFVDLLTYNNTECASYIAIDILYVLWSLSTCVKCQEH